MTQSGTDAQVGISACLEDVVRAFHDGQAIIEKIKKKRALKRAPPPPRLLEESIDDSPIEIEREKQRGLNRFGKSFEDGDPIAIIALQQITIQLQSSLLEKLRNAAFDDDNKITDFTYLVDAADTGRDRTIAVLHELKQRLITSLQCQDEASVPPQNGRQPPHETDGTIRDTSDATSISEDHATSITIKSSAKHSTSSKDFSEAQDGSGQHDTTPDTEDSNRLSGHRKRTSLLGFLKNHRAHSGESKDAKEKQSAQQPKVEESAHTHPPASVIKGAPSSQYSNVDPFASKEPQSPSNHVYGESEDLSHEIWGSRPSFERHETFAIAPDQSAENSSSSNNLPANPPSPVLTNRSNSTQYSQPSFAHQSHLTSTAIPTPNPENDFLGFCKCAWKLQNGDRKGSFAKCRDVEPWSRHPSSSTNAAHYLTCQQQRCAFRSSFSANDVNTIWRRVFTIEPKGIKLRWQFLAKSHVPQKVVVKHQYSFLCLFCIFTTGKSAVCHGIDFYLDHIDHTHRKQRLNDVVLYKTGCINDRIASDDEEFDICLFPASNSGDADQWKREDELLNDDLMNYTGTGLGRTSKEENDSMFSNEPWNEGLSDFHYGDGMEYEQI